MFKGSGRQWVNSLTATAKKWWFLNVKNTRWYCKVCRFKNSRETCENNHQKNKKWVWGLRIEEKKSQQINLRRSRHTARRCWCRQRWMIKENICDDIFIRRLAIKLVALPLLMTVYSHINMWMKQLKDMA